MAALLVGLGLAQPALARLDVEDRGPQLQAGSFAMRITNIGVIGNPFFDVGRSFDPSFEFPRGSGQDGMKWAELWVGGSRPGQRPRVSGGPLLEFRPSLDPDDRVREAFSGRLGARRFVDDDGDRRVDEETFNLRDDDGDGEVDEDLGLAAAQTLFAEYRDDRRESVDYGYPNGERHEPLHVSVRQQAMAWSLPGFDKLAGLRFEIRNEGEETLENMWLGFVADLDAKGANDPAGQLDDVVTQRSFALSIDEGTSRIPSVTTDNGPYARRCVTEFRGTGTIVVDGTPGVELPAFGILPLSHTVDPIAMIAPRSSRPDMGALAYAPAQLTFRTRVFARDLPPTQGGLPLLDADRYLALQGAFPGAVDSTIPHDYVVLVSCGPFPRVAPGRTLTLDVALVTGANPDSVGTGLAAAAIAFNGRTLNVEPDTLATLSGQWDVGRSGFTGHESCVTAPPGVRFNTDAHCVSKFPDNAVGPTLTADFYDDTHCIWTDADCDACTGFGGAETRARWGDPGAAPPQPAQRKVAGDDRVVVEWDNLPEVLLSAGVAGAEGARFLGYYLYRLSDWRRTAVLPPPASFQTLAFFAADTIDGSRPLAAARDTTVPYDRILFGQRVYPVGRYRYVDTSAINGFDYVYVVSTVSERTVPIGNGLTRREFIESPLVASIDSIVTPRREASARSGEVWVVPNPYRARVAWDRTPVPGDTFGRHLDFYGLPRALATIKIWTVAGDFVAQVDHDGRGGNGQAKWNLISRNGQDVESGIYLFTVDSPLGHQVGRFVVMR